MRRSLNSTHWKSWRKKVESPKNLKSWRGLNWAWTVVAVWLDCWR